MATLHHSLLPSCADSESASAIIRAILFLLFFVPVTAQRVEFPRRHRNSAYPRRHIRVIMSESPSHLIRVRGCITIGSLARRLQHVSEPSYPSHYIRVTISKSLYWRHHTRAIRSESLYPSRRARGLWLCGRSLGSRARTSRARARQRKRTHACNHTRAHERTGTHTQTERERERERERKTEREKEREGERE